ncbi:hypothetical protein BaRGS_00006660, partial [Batillaria attramentaria]
MSKRSRYPAAAMFTINSLPRDASALFPPSTTYYCCARHTCSPAVIYDNVFETK